MDHYDVVVVGAGWAGLSVSYELMRAKISHIVMERGRVGETWRTQRWESFHMNTPNALTVLPGDRYEGSEPEGFMSCQSFIEMLETYADRWRLPVHEQTAVEDLRRIGDRFQVKSTSGVVIADKVVIAAGNLNVPRIPKIASKLPSSIYQIHGVEYTSAAALPHGAVVVVGCGDTGGQIAEELMEAGRRVYLSTGRNGRVPRRYRGRDFFIWMTESKLNQNPRPPGNAGRALIGRKRTITLQSMSAKGVTVTGRVRDATASGKLLFDDTLAESAAYADETSAGVKEKIDAYIEREGIDAPLADDDPEETVSPKFPEPPLLELDLIASGVSSVIWATGLSGNFDWLRIPGTVDAYGTPIQEKSVSAPGVYFVGLDSKETQRSGTVLGASCEAARVAAHIELQRA
ncbi:NAD(P)/FAD-dependent oxidoreductase [Tropicimonas sp. IMCC6043]|uniref:flavin-containing monooxygenase n=1 Tax=Tropicimonas sp. IMCC6043 TaxID=2510645 RepID=UPI00101DF368|nr:NAD(P)/FAD-dependent oxidoreductase [Tropicimonas sp. IMCC6043]RYH07008.1 FAD-dependent oxidoreductase [Tropicimonas sp. IMCC6043]